MTTATQTPRLADDCQRGSHSVQRLVPHHGRTHLDLFSGIGGFALAAASAGFKTIGFSEIEPYSCAVLKKHWPEIKNYGDIRNIRGVKCDLITGGFPCQPFSHAGKRKGASDDRALWPEMCRVIDESKPSWVLGENVAGIISMELDRVLSDLESLGYSAWPIVIPACALDAPHRRDRVWILANRDSGGGSAKFGKQQTERAALADASGAGNVADAESESIRAGLCAPEQNNEERSETRWRRLGNDGESLSEAQGVGLQGQRASGEQIASAHERATIPVCCSSDSAIWPTEPELGRVAHGIPNRTHRLKGLGNAIVPQVAAEILTALVMGNARAKQTRKGSSDELS